MFKCVTSLHVTRSNSKLGECQNPSNFMKPLTVPCKVGDKHGGFSGKKCTELGEVQQVKGLQHKHEAMSSNLWYPHHKARQGSTCL